MALSICLEFGPKMRFFWWKYARIPKMHSLYCRCRW